MRENHFPAASRPTATVYSGPAPVGERKNVLVPSGRAEPFMVNGPSLPSHGDGPFVNITGRTSADYIAHLKREDSGSGAAATGDGHVAATGDEAILQQVDKNVSFVRRAIAEYNSAGECGCWVDAGHPANTKGAADGQY